MKQTHSDIPLGSVPNWTGGPSHAVPSQSETAINFNTLPPTSHIFPLHFVLHPPAAQTNRPVFTLGQILIRTHSDGNNETVKLTSLVQIAASLSLVTIVSHFPTFTENMVVFRHVCEPVRVSLLLIVSGINIAEVAQLIQGLDGRGVAIGYC